MTERGPIKVEEKPNKFRSADASDIRASEPDASEVKFIGEESIFEESEIRLPDEVREAARKKSLAKEVREEHQGEGFVILDVGTGRIIDVVDDLQGARNILVSSEYRPEETLVVSCYER